MIMENRQHPQVDGKKTALHILFPVCAEASDKSHSSFVLLKLGLFLKSDSSSLFPFSGK